MLERGADVYARAGAFADARRIGAHAISVSAPLGLAAAPLASSAVLGGSGCVDASQLIGARAAKRLVLGAIGGIVEQSKLQVPDDATQPITGATTERTPA